MNLTDLRTRILYRVGRADDTTLENDITYALESVQDEITSDIPFPELMVFDSASLNLTANTQEYDLPADFQQGVIFWNNDSFEEELVRLNPIEYRQYWSNISKLTGTNPIYYDILGSGASGSTYRKKIRFFPYPADINNGIIAGFAQLTGVPAAFADYNATVNGAVQITDVAHGLISGMTVTIAGTVNYNGTFEVTVIDADNFYIMATYVAEIPGGGETWTADGTTVTDVDHGLATGDYVTISGTTNYNGSYEAIVIDDDTFYIAATYVAEAGANTKLWAKNKIIPFVYIKGIDYLSGSNTENALSYAYPQLYIEGGAYYLYRDVLYRDQPEKIAFRRAEFDRIKNQVIRDLRQADRISEVVPKRYLNGMTRYYRVQTTGYIS